MRSNGRNPDRSTSPVITLRYQQQYDFFDITKLNKSIRFVNLSQVLIDGGLAAVLGEISKQVDAIDPGIVVVDSFRSVLRTKQESKHELEVQGFMQQLAVLLTTCEATTFLIGEYGEDELEDNPVFTVADGLLWLYQMVEGNSVVRKLQLMKVRDRCQSRACTPSASPITDSRRSPGL